MEHPNCNYCFGDSASDHLQYPCGTKIKKFFPQGPFNEAGWFAGTILNHFTPEEVNTTTKRSRKVKTNMWNLVEYEDGDNETLTNEELADASVVEIVSIGEATKPDQTEELSSSSQPTVKIKARKAGPKPRKERAATKARKKARIDNSTREIKGHTDDHDTNSEATPEPVYSVHNPPPRSACIVAPLPRVKKEENKEAVTPTVKKEESTVVTPTVKKEESTVVTPNESPSSSRPTSPKTDTRESSTTAQGSRQVAVKAEDDDTTGATENEHSAAIKREDGDGTTMGTRHENDDSSEAEQAAEPGGSCKERDDNDPVVPDVPVSTCAQIVGEVFDTANQDIKVKAEGSASILSDEQRRKRQEAFDDWVHANTDPKTGLGRYVFRRTCHKEGTICTVLKGAGMDPWPLVKQPPRLYQENIVNPFIKPGEFYVAGNESWNPFGPRFPGDKEYRSLLSES